MPAHRSEAEAEIRTAVVDRLRILRPQARILHEINTRENGNRIDVLAVSPDEIVTVEVKSSKDKLERLPSQILAMRGCSHHTVAAIHERFLVEQKTNEWAAHFERDGEHYRFEKPDESRGADMVWVHPIPDEIPSPPKKLAARQSLHRWLLPDPALQSPLPAETIKMLWADDLKWLCNHLKIHTGSRPTKSLMINILRWHATGRDLTRGICEALRRRECIEADPPISEEGATT